MSTDLKQPPDSQTTNNLMEMIEVDEISSSVNREEVVAK